MMTGRSRIALTMLIISLLTSFRAHVTFYPFAPHRQH
jgi:hypothetical protein